MSYAKPVTDSLAAILADESTALASLADAARRIETIHRECFPIALAPGLTESGSGLLAALRLIMDATTLVRGKAENRANVVYTSARHLGLDCPDADEWRDVAREVAP